jgi:hypothetical protein
MICAACLLVLTSCGSWKPSADLGEKVSLQPLPAQVRTCPASVTVDVNAEYSFEKVVKDWARDRNSLAVCRRNLDLSIAYIDDIQTGFSDESSKVDHVPP